MSWTYCAPKSRTSTGRDARSESESTEMPPYRLKPRRFRPGRHLASQWPSLPDEAGSANSPSCDVPGRSAEIVGPGPERVEFPIVNRSAELAVPGARL